MNKSDNIVIISSKVLLMQNVRVTDLWRWKTFPEAPMKRIDIYLRLLFSAFIIKCNYLIAYKNNNVIKQVWNVFEKFISTFIIKRASLTSPINASSSYFVKYGVNAFFSQMKNFATSRSSFPFLGNLIDSNRSAPIYLWVTHWKTPKQLVFARPKPIKCRL